MLGVEVIDCKYKLCVVCVCGSKVLIDFQRFCYLELDELVLLYLEDVVCVFCFVFNFEIIIIWIVRVGYRFIFLQCFGKVYCFYVNVVFLEFLFNQCFFLYVILEFVKRCMLVCN